MIEIEQLGSFNKDNLECEFIAHYKDYNIKGQIDCEIESFPEDQSVGLKEAWSLFTCNYWHIEIYNDSGKIGLFAEEKQSALNDVENYFDELVQSF